MAQPHVAIMPINIIIKCCFCNLHTNANDIDNGFVSNAKCLRDGAPRAQFIIRITVGDNALDAQLKSYDNAVTWERDAHTSAVIVLKLKAKINLQSGTRSSRPKWEKKRN